jgi:hypothetical protein
LLLYFVFVFALLGNRPKMAKNRPKNTQKVPKVAQKWPTMTNLPAISATSAVKIVLPQCAAAQAEFAAAALLFTHINAE